MKATQKRLKCTRKLYLEVNVSASTASKDRKEKRDNQNKNTANEVKKAVNARLGLTSVPNTPPPGVPRGDNDSDTSMIAMNLKGKDRFMYGNEASKYTNEEMEKRGLLSYNPTTGGYSNVVNGQIISNANTIKYGSSNSAMGSGDPTGAMTSIPLSKEMLKSQNKFKGLVVGALSLGMPGIGATAMRADAAVALKDAKQSGAAYDDYTKKFDATQKGKKFTSLRNTSGLIQLGLSKGKDKLGEVFGN